MSAKGLSGWVGSKNCSWVQANYGNDKDPMALLRDVIGKIRDHSYITSAIMTDGVGGFKKLQFLVTFSTLFMLKWVGWSEKIQKCIDVICGLSLINKKGCIVFLLSRNAH